MKPLPCPKYLKFLNSERVEVCWGKVLGSTVDEKKYPALAILPSSAVQYDVHQNSEWLLKVTEPRSIITNVPC